jgi:DNA-binding CsgD family transcriptional regulator
MAIHDELVARALATSSRRELCEVSSKYVYDVLGAQLASVVLAPRETGEIIAGVRGAPATRVLDYAREVGPGADPVLAEACRWRAPVHNLELFSESAWQRHRFYQAYARRFGTEHYLVAPLVGVGKPSGFIHVTRSPHQAPFDSRALRIAAGLASQLSVLVSFLPEASGPDDVALTVRERQVALLVVNGMNNPMIAQHLGIARETVKQTLRRVYRKLDVNGRAAMAARLGVRERES